jgi:hypothetical protein
MALLKKTLEKMKRAVQTVSPLPMLYFRFLVYLMSSGKKYPHKIHEFSQLLIIPAYFRRLPGMTTGTERAYFQWYAQYIYSGCGAIVDLGCWLGSTTIPLARGLKKNMIKSSSKDRIYAYDEFIWTLV